MCVLLDMYEERGEKRGIAIGEERGITIGEERGEARGIYEINTLNLHLLDDNRLEDMQRAMVDTDYQKRTYERIRHWRIVKEACYWEVKI